MLTPEYPDAPPLEPPPQLAASVVALPSIVEIADLDALPLPPIQVDLLGQDKADLDAELMARVKFAGIYESQVRARIERAWQMLDARDGDADFSCMVLIHQNRSGRVVSVEIDLDHCKGSPAMRASLVNAINAASPLPAPPHPSVFVDRFTLEFHSKAVAQSATVVQR